MKKKRNIISGFMILASLLLTIGCDLTESNNDGNSENNETPTAVTIAAIPGITPPAAGETPVTEIIETDQYTETVS